MKNTEITLKSVPITVERTESNFDRACDQGFRMAVSHFGIDDAGHSTKLGAWDRSDCWVELLFVGYQRIDSTHLYTFTAAAKKDTSD